MELQTVGVNRNSTTEFKERLFEVKKEESSTVAEFKEKQSADSEIKESSTVTEVNKDQLEVSEMNKVQQTVAESTSNIKTEVEEKQPKTVVLSGGKTLRLLALELFGDKEFWVYIYKENIDVIPNPNKVSSGLILRIPDTDKYFIDSSNPESVARARFEGARVLKK